MVSTQTSTRCGWPPAWSIWCGISGSLWNPPICSWSTGTRFPHLGKEYIQMLQDGVIAASYLEGWRSQNKEAVLVAPAYTFLMMNRPVTAQFWLDAGSSGWSQRLAQPLTHPYVLTREWSRAEFGQMRMKSRTAARHVSSCHFRFLASLPEARRTCVCGTRRKRLRAARRFVACLSKGDELGISWLAG